MKKYVKLVCISYLGSFLRNAVYLLKDWMKFKTDSLFMTRMWNVATMYYSIFIFFHKHKLTYFWFYFVFLFPAFTRCWSLDVFCLNWKNLKPAAHRLVWYPVTWDCRQWLLRSLRWHRQKELTQSRASVWPLLLLSVGRTLFSLAYLLFYRRRG